MDDQDESLTVAQQIRKRNQEWAEADPNLVSSKVYRLDEVPDGDPAIIDGPTSLVSYAPSLKQGRSPRKRSDSQ